MISSGTEEPPLDIDDCDHAQTVAAIDQLNESAPTIDDMFGPLDKLESTPTTREILALEATNLRLLKAAMKGSRAKRNDKSPTSTKISIRIPNPVLDSMKAEATRTGVPYQTLLNYRLCAIATGHA